MLTGVPRFRKLDIDFHPQDRLSGLRLARCPVDGHVEILEQDPALSRQRAEEPRQRLQNSGLTRTVGAENIRQIVEVDRCGLWPEGLKATQPQSRDLHRRLLARYLRWP